MIALWVARWFGRNLRFVGLGRLLSWMYPCAADSRRHVLGIFRRADGLKMRLDSRHWIEWNLLFYGRYEQHLYPFFAAFLPKDSVAIDVGANVGAHTLTFSKLVGSGGKVLAIEPNPLAVVRLKENLSLNAVGQALVFECGLGAETGDLPLRVPSPGSLEFSNLGLASFVALDTPHNLIEVPIRTFDEIFIDSHLDRVDLIKIDVQGYECQCLSGMALTLQRYSPAIVFEYEGWAWSKAGKTLEDAIRFLRKWDYQLYQIVLNRLKLPSLKIFEGHYEDLPEHLELIALKSGDLRKNRWLQK